MLQRKLARELWGQRKLTLSVVLVLTLGVTAFEASAVSYLNLLESYADTQRRMALADWHINADGVTPDDVDRVRKAPGVAAAEARVVASLPLVVPEGRLAQGVTGRVKVEARLITFQQGEPWLLDQVLLRRGTLPERPDQVVVEEHFATHHGLEPGDRLEFELAGLTRSVEVSGVAVSAEYIWVCRDRHDIFPSPVEFGVVWIDRAQLRAVVQAGMAALMTSWRSRAAGLDPKLLAALQGSEQLKSLMLAGRPKVGNQLLIQVAPGHDRAAVLQAARAVLGDRAGRATARENLASVELLQMDLDAIRGLAAFFPFLFLGLGACVVATLLTRMVDAQRPLIGTMLALGVPRRRVLLHYLAFALIIGVVGALAGTVLGYIVGGIVTQIYAAELTIPYVTQRPHWDVIGTGFALGVGAAALAGVGPARRAASILPASAMRPPAPSVSRAAFLVRSLGSRLPVPARLAIRNLARKPLRALAGAGGVAAALVLILASWGSIDSTNRAIHVQFTLSQRYHLRADMLTFVAPAELEERIRAAAGADGVEQLETALTLPVQLTGAQGSYETVLQGLPDDGQLLRTVEFNGARVAPRGGGLLLTRGIAEKIGAAVGDTIAIRPMFLGNGKPRMVRLDGLSDAAMGGTAFMRLPDAQATFGRDGLVNTALLTTRAERWRVRERLQALPQIARITDVVDLQERMDELMKLTYLLLAVLLLFGVVLGVSILFNVVTQNIIERRRELATMRALGLPMSGIATMMTIEHALLGLLGLALGVPLSVATLRYVNSLYDNDLFSMPLYVAPTTLVVSLLGVLLVLFAVQWPSLRYVGRLNLADSVREREG